MEKKCVVWDKRHGDIFNSIISNFEQHCIRNFLLRNHEGLPNRNLSKDVDIIVEPGKIKKAIELLKKVYKDYGLDYFYYVKYEKGHNCKGINLNDSMAIHIDLMEGYSSRGCEIYTFDELYEQTISFKNFRILNETYFGLMILIYKQFGYKNPFFNDKYREIIFHTYNSCPAFKTEIIRLTGDYLSTKIFKNIEIKDFDKINAFSNSFTKSLQRFALIKAPLKTIKNALLFYWEKFDRIILNYRRYSKVFAVMGPDGSGKTTFLNALIDNLKFYYVDGRSSYRFNLYHHRPCILPNLGEVSEKIGYKDQDKDFTNPHRAKPANKFSSLVRLIYYWLDYIIGFNLLVRKDVQRDRFSIFDRYSYDFLVDPGRIRLNLPFWIRNMFVKFMPHPKIVFYLDALPEVIFKRKKELSLDEIYRQNKIFKNLTSSHQRFVVLDSNRPVEQSVNEATSLILDSFTIKL
jgi:thymidylate kinase